MEIATLDEILMMAAGAGLEKLILPGLGRQRKYRRKIFPGAGNWSVPTSFWQNLWPEDVLSRKMAGLF